MDLVLKSIETKDFQYVSKTPDYTQIFVYLPQGSWRKYCEKLKIWFTFLPEGIQMSINKYKGDGSLEKYTTFFTEEHLAEDEQMLAHGLQHLLFPERGL